MKVGIVGVGYVGLSTAVCLATKFTTVAVDKDSTRVEALGGGVSPKDEKGLGALLKKGLSTRRLSFSSDVTRLSGSDVIFVAVGTPSHQDGSIDLTQVRGAAFDIGSVLRNASNRPLVLIRSTVVPGTAREVVKPILEQASGKECGQGFDLCSNPEFLREGTAIQDCLAPNRLVIGAFGAQSLAAALSLYRKFYGSKIPHVIETTPEGAELIKYASNSFLAAKVSFVNLIAMACELYPGTDVSDVARAMGLDPRIGPQFLQAGPGFGGSCLPKDVRAFSLYLKQLALDSSILESVLRINEFQPGHVVALAEKKAGGLAGKVVAVLGIAFKAGTGDTRESRSIPLIRGLISRGAGVRVYDPFAMEAAKSELGPGVTYAASAKECITGADVAITMTASKEIKSLKPRDFKSMRVPVLIDARRVYSPVSYSEGINYEALGRGQGTKS